MTASTANYPTYQSVEWKRQVSGRIGRTLARRRATRPIEPMPETHRPEIGADVGVVVVGLMSLRVDGGVEVPPAIRALLPDPLATLEGWQRFTHADIATMSPAERSAEAWRFRVGLAQVDPELVPAWALDRLSRLEGAA